ncbi:Gfo/Idh/MocA family oxidoreductase [Caldilinea sp.]|uniref:Gfo/Idh/MocA family protein n=1 Tax=Caldilinea sp. TaxID=2293560 RepID=UPI002CE9CD77|nr:Gfo/Idh/MocA family oxidoreductase [Caldilinea sp.]HRA67624.1 Gfo/Idh/MocA family oxidoreductase [Caldilinea sp.]
MTDRLRVGVIGAGRWSASAHLPGFTRSPLCDVVMLCDLDRELGEARARQFGIPEFVTDYEKMLARTDIDVIDVVTRADHQQMVFDVLEAGKHCLVEKPVCHDYRDVWRAQRLAESKGLKTKVGLTFRYAPAVQYMFELQREGFIGQPFVFNGYEQNSQWLDPDNPMDKRIHKTKPVGEAEWGTDLSRAGIHVSSLEGYGAPTIDIGLELVGSELAQVVGILANLVPYRRRTNLDTGRERINIDDADMFIGECANGAIYSMQSSYVTVGNYPGIEARIYGSEGALIARLVDEFGQIQTLRAAKPDAVEFVQLEIPQRFFPPGYRPDDPWSTAFYGNLVHNFLEEIVAGGETNQGNFAQSARVQEIINAVALSHRERRWVDLPLPEDLPYSLRTES